jgi:hypothetical protein
MPTTVSILASQPSSVDSSIQFMPTISVQHLNEVTHAKDNYNLILHNNIDTFNGVKITFIATNTTQRSAEVLLALPEFTFMQLDVNTQ